MRLAHNTRNLSSAEQQLAFRVFDTSLPPWRLIYITDGLGLGDAPWTDDPFMFYFINVGPVGYPDCTSVRPLGDFGRICDVFIHEMTHVWQYYHDYWVKSSSIAARGWEKVSGDDAYRYSLGKSWMRYNVEEQASIVEDWFSGGMSTSDDRYVYIEKVIRPGVDASGLDPRNIFPPDKLQSL